MTQRSPVRHSIVERLAAVFANTLDTALRRAGRPVRQVRVVVPVEATALGNILAPRRALISLAVGRELVGMAWSSIAVRTGVVLATERFSRGGVDAEPLGDMRCRRLPYVFGWLCAKAEAG